jgi:GAF domain-containing protein
MAATRDILDAIHQHRGDEAPVFDTILENALRLCAADMAVVNTANEAWTEVGYAAGIHSAGPEFQPGRNSWPIESPQFLCRAIFENRTFHTPDLMDTDLYRSGDVTRRNLVDNEGMRTQLVLPLVQGDRAIASFSLYRQKMQPFSDTEISLLETFAAQAVIAIENVRQFR